MSGPLEFGTSRAGLGLRQASPQLK